MSALVELSCQLCGARRGETVYERTFDSLALGRVGVRLVCCPDCGFLYASPRPTPEAMRAHYAEGSFASGAVWREQGTDSRQERFVRARAAFLLRHLGGDARAVRILDVGCSRGDFLSALELPGWQRCGLEPGRRAAEAARARGLAVVEETLEENHLLSESFDAVTCFSVLEHVWDVRAAMQGLERLVAPGGLLVLYVPDSTRPVAQVAEFFALEHLSHFSAGTLTRLLRDFGFRPESLEEAEGPGLIVAARKVGRSALRSLPVPDDRARLVRAVTAYAAERERFECALRERFDEHLTTWERDRARLAVFGAGEHTRFLFDLVPLRGLCVALLDGDPAKQGRRILGLPVHVPEALPELDVDAVVLSSEPFQEEMAARIGPLAEAGGVTLVRCYPERRRAA